MVKLRFKKWWWNLKPSFRRWKKDCEKYLNNEQDKITEESVNLAVFGTTTIPEGFKNPCLPLYRQMYGKDFPNPQKDFGPITNINTPNGTVVDIGRH